MLPSEAANTPLVAPRGDRTSIKLPAYEPHAFRTPVTCARESDQQSVLLSFLTLVYYRRRAAIENSYDGVTGSSVKT